MTQPFVHGPVHIYVGIGGTPTYLGTGEKAPLFRIRRFFDKVMNDLAGSIIPFDYLYEGIEAYATVRLTRWDETVRLMAQDVVAQTTDPGAIDAGELGTLMVLEGAAQGLWLQYSYGPGQISAKTAMSTMIPGYHAVAAFLEDPDGMGGGTDPAFLDFSWHCVRAYDPVTGGFTLFDTNMSGLPTPD